VADADSVKLNKCWTLDSSKSDTTMTRYRRRYKPNQLTQSAVLLYKICAFSTSKYEQRQSTRRKRRRINGSGAHLAKINTPQQFKFCQLAISNSQNTFFCFEHCDLPHRIGKEKSYFKPHMFTKQIVSINTSTISFSKSVVSCCLLSPLTAHH
jgi:hypothetical protein